MTDHQSEAPGPIAWMIVDRDESIQTHSRALRSLISAPEGVIDGRSFGEVSGCINAVVEHSRCGSTTRCGSCALNRSIRRARAGHANGPDVLHRTCILDGRLVERAYRFVSRPIEGPQRRQVLVQFEQLTSARALWKPRAHKAHAQPGASAPLPHELLAVVAAC